MLYNKYRPTKLSQVAGQPATKEILSGLIKSEQIPHAMMFLGMTGCGKTTTARIMAMAINCIGRNDDHSQEVPCGQCRNCLDIKGGRCPDVEEIDAASNNGVDNARILRQNATFSPTQCDKKIYIIDEFHMMTPQACNALLKTIEEPPPRCHFILCTTEEEKVLETIKNRCMKFHFTAIPQQSLRETILNICHSEGYSITDEALAVLSHTTKGLREIICRLEAAMVESDKFGSGKAINETIAASVCRIMKSDIIRVLVNGVASSRIDIILTVLEAINKSGYDLKNVTEQVIDSMHNIIRGHYLGGSQTAVDETFCYAIDRLVEARQKMDNHLIARCVLDVAFIDCCEKAKVKIIP